MVPAETWRTARENAPGISAVPTIGSTESTCASLHSVIENIWEAARRAWSSAARRAPTARHWIQTPLVAIGASTIWLPWESAIPSAASSALIAARIAAACSVAVSGVHVPTWYGKLHDPTFVGITTSCPFGAMSNSGE